MLIGVPKEIKTNENRVALVPAGAEAFFAAAEDLTRAVIDSGAIAVAYETVQLPSGELPLLTPMSEVAGRMSVQEGAKYLEKVFGGSGVLLGGVPGVAPGEVVIIGGGVV